MIYLEWESTRDPRISHLFFSKMKSITHETGALDDECLSTRHHLIPRLGYLVSQLLIIFFEPLKVWLEWVFYFVRVATVHLEFELASSEILEQCRKPLNVGACETSVTLSADV